jgi:putative transposase
VTASVAGRPTHPRRNGFTPQVPAHRAAERDEDAIAEWRTVTWAKIRGPAAAAGAWICFEDEVGQTLRPRRARTWGRRGRTPVVRLSGKGSGRVSAAGLACLKAGSPARFFFRLRQHRGRKGERRSMSESDYAALVSAAHRTLGAPVILIWDNLNTHRSRKMRRLAAARASWLTVFCLPSYAPDLNPVEGAWSSLKAGLGNLSASTLCQLTAAVRSRLTRIQRQPALIAGCLGQTGLTLESQPP